MRVAIQGALGSYSECAAKTLVEDPYIVPCKDYPDLFDAIARGRADCMVIPMENSTAGSVYPYYDLLLEHATRHDFRITKELKLIIRHNLIGHPDAKFGDITEVRSHPQALEQCIGFIRKNKFEANPRYDTAGAVDEMMQRSLKHVAAVASVQAAKDHGWTILRRNIQDQHEDNTTRFVVIQPGPDQVLTKAKRVKVSLAFCIENVPGSLYRVLAPFGAHSDVGIIRIESRPLVGTTTSWRKLVQRHEGKGDKGIWDLVYYLDFACPGVKVDGVLKKLEGLVLKNKTERAIQVFGRYLPENTRVDGTKKPWR
ncbi:MAG TPA: prephenate dehydratase domain-containing protein [Bryobacteraceae bacterium]|jgi:prephenate dehydratase